MSRYEVNGKAVSRMPSNMRPTCDAQTSRVTSVITGDTIAEICHDMVWPHLKATMPTFTLEEFAALIMKSERNARRYLDGEYELTTSQFLAVSTAAFWKGDRRLTALAVPRHHTLTCTSGRETNGSVCDEIADIVQFEGRMREAFDAGDLEQASFWSAQAKAAQLGIDKEIEERKEHQHGH